MKPGSSAEVSESWPESAGAGRLGPVQISAVRSAGFMSHTSFTPAVKYCASLRWILAGVSLGESTSAAMSGTIWITFAFCNSARRSPRITATSCASRVVGDKAYRFAILAKVKHKLDEEIL